MNFYKSKHGIEVESIVRERPVPKKCAGCGSRKDPATIKLTDVIIPIDKGAPSRLDGNFIINSMTTPIINITIPVIYKKRHLLIIFLRRLYSTPKGSFLLSNHLTPAFLAHIDTTYPCQVFS